MSATESWLLSEKSLTRLLSATWRATMSWSGAAYLSVVIALLPLAAAQAFGQYLAANLGVLKLQQELQSGSLNPMNMDFRPFVVLGAYQVAAYVVWFVAGFVATAAVTRILAERAVGRPAGVSEGFESALGALPRLVAGAFALMLVSAAALAIGAVPAGIASVVLAATTGATVAPGNAQVLTQAVGGVFVLIPMAILGTYVSVMPAAAAVERLGGFGAMARSFRLVAGSLGRVLAATLIVGAALWGPMAGCSVAMNAWALKPLQAMLGEANGALAAGAPSALLLLLLSPFIYTLPAVLYLELRVRKDDDGLSPERLAEELGYAPTASAADRVSVDGDSGRR